MNRHSHSITPALLRVGAGMVAGFAVGLAIAAAFGAI